MRKYVELFALQAKDPNEESPRWQQLCLYTSRSDAQRAASQWEGHRNEQTRVVRREQRYK